MQLYSSKTMIYSRSNQFPYGNYVLMASHGRVSRRSPSGSPPTELRAARLGGLGALHPCGWDAKASVGIAMLIGIYYLLPTQSKYRLVSI